MERAEAVAAAEVGGPLAWLLQYENCIVNILLH